jgi:hypothetical protein
VRTNVRVAILWTSRDASGRSWLKVRTPRAPPAGSRPG